MLTAWLISRLMGRNVIANAARLRLIGAYSNTTINWAQVECWRCNSRIATTGQLGRCVTRAAIQQPASVREEQQERLSYNKRRGVRHIDALILQSVSMRGQQARLAIPIISQKNDDDDTGGG